MKVKELLNRLMKGIEDWSGPRLAGEGQSCQGNCKALVVQWAGEEGRCWLACDMTIHMAIWGQKTECLMLPKVNGKPPRGFKQGPGCVWQGTGAEQARRLSPQSR